MEHAPPKSTLPVIIQPFIVTFIIFLRTGKAVRTPSPEAQCVSENGAADLAEVVVVGTMYQWHLHSPMYSLEVLTDLIKRTDPEVLCIEFSPEQLENESACAAKPEYPDAIMPFAEKNGIPLVSLQQRTESWSEYQRMVQKEIDRIRSDPEMSVKWEFWTELRESMGEVYSRSLFDFLCQAYDTWIEIVHGKFYSRLFPELGRLWDEWNQQYLETITKTIEDNPDRRITVTVGVQHKYWLNNRLRSMESVNFRHVQEFLTPE